VPLLLDRCELGVALVDDHVEKRIAHLLRWHLAQIFPLASALKGAELDLLGFNRPIESIEFETGNLIAIDADFLAPSVEEANPFTEGSDFCYFSGHNFISS
jgi:hypothetical protein